MGFKLAAIVRLNGTGGRDPALDRVRAADEAGMHTLWVPEAWSEDAVPAMTLIAEHTRNVQIGSYILNVFSRTPGLMAQTFATLDQISNGRMIIGLGSSSANVVEHFHGLQFKTPLRRIHEYVDVINMIMRKERLHYDGRIFKLDRGFTLRMDLVRTHIPIYIAALTPKSVLQTAEIADGWIPFWTPLQDIPAEVRRFHAAAEAAGRDPNSLTVHSPGGITLTTAANVEAQRRAVAESLAFYLARMGNFYHEHVARLGYAAEVAAIRKAFDEGGQAAAGALVPGELQQQLGFVTDSVDAARERLAAQQAAGIDLHTVSVGADSAAEQQRLYESLIG